MREKIRHFAIDFLAIFANMAKLAYIFDIMAKIFRLFPVIFRHLAILAYNFLTIFVIMAKTARMAKKFIAIFRHSYYFSQKSMAKWQ